MLHSVEAVGPEVAGFACQSGRSVSRQAQSTTGGETSGAVFRGRSPGTAGRCSRNAEGIDELSFGAHGRFSVSPVSGDRRVFMMGGALSSSRLNSSRGAWLLGPLAASRGVKGVGFFCSTRLSGVRVAGDEETGPISMAQLSGSPQLMTSSRPGVPGPSPSPKKMERLGVRSLVSHSDGG